MGKIVALIWISLLACGNKKDSAQQAAGSGSAVAAPPPTVAPGSAAGSAADPEAGSATGDAQAKACDGGDATACVAAARAIAPKGGYRADLTKEDADAKEAATTKLAARACELKNGEGCALVAQFGAGANGDKLLEQACELGYVPSCGSVGDKLAHTKERQRAAELLEKACTADAVDWRALTSHHGGFCHELYELYGRMKDKVKAAKALERQCAQGYKYKCACKAQADCGSMPESMSGDFDCQDGVCEITGGG